MTEPSSNAATRKNRTKPGWKYCHPLVKEDTNTIVCNYCGKITNGGIMRAKEHLVGKLGNVASCKKTPPDVIEKLKGYIANKKSGITYSSTSSGNMPNIRDFEFGEPIGCDESEDEFEDSCNAIALAAKTKAGLSFNLIKLKCFENMVVAIGQYGPHLPIPSYHDIRVSLLKKEVEYTENLMKGYREQWIGEKLFELLDAIMEKVGEENVVQVVIDNGSNYVSASKLLEDKRKHIYWTPCAAHYIDLMLEDTGKLPLIRKRIRRTINLVGFIYAHSGTLSLLKNYTNKRELVKHAITRFVTSYLTLEMLHKEKSNITKMFISDEWILNKLSKEPKGQETTKLVFMPSFWNSVVYTLKVMAPFVKVLRLVDDERKPAMGYIYEAMNKAKETIIKSFNNNESKYKEVFAIIAKRWNCQLHRSLHAAAHFLNPEFFYDNIDLEFDFKVTNGLFDCIKKLVPQFDVQQKILTELHLYKIDVEHFGSKILSYALSWYCSILVANIHSIKRNRLEHKKLHDLVFVKYNQQLKQRYNARDEIDPISLNDIDLRNE
ncbi:uncharacterized protein [Glycine max]|uniref:uncharacterized protein n=1 Tax=Glycine max TaxID=3847 RepID=UPI001B355315|nr:uncharacterized protein LOC106794326 [Glycine max]